MTVLSTASRRQISVVAALIVRRGQDGAPSFLVSLRHGRDDRPGQWEFPGGKLEMGETEEAALARELAEELGAVFQVGPHLRRWSFAYPTLEVHLSAYWCRLVSGTPAPLEMQEIRWVSAAGMATLDFLEADRGLVAELASGAVPVPPALLID